MASYMAYAVEAHLKTLLLASALLLGAVDRAYPITDPIENGGGDDGIAEDAAPSATERFEVIIMLPCS